MIVSLAIAVVLALLAYWAVRTLVTDAKIQRILVVLIVVVFVLWLLGALTGFHFPRG